MNYEVIDSPRRIAEQDARDQEALQAELAMHDDFVQACRAGNVNAKCGWAPLAAQFDGTKYERTKVQALHEVMDGSLDYTNGPSSADLMALLCSVAYGADNVNSPARARSLISQMASTFAKFNAGEA